MDEWWTFASNGTRTVVLIPAYFKAALFCLFFGAFGRGLAQSFRSKTTENGEEDLLG
jgi:hypothetical protein